LTPEQLNAINTEAGCTLEGSFIATVNPYGELLLIRVEGKKLVPGRVLPFVHEATATDVFFCAPDRWGEAMRLARGR